MLLFILLLDEVDFIKSQVIRTELESILVLGRATQGVRIMKLRDGNTITSLTLL